jgi:hypothetical protein
MDEELTKTKRRVSKKFLGKSGIHGVGIHPSKKDTVVVYKNKSKQPEEELCRDIAQEAKPFKVEIVEEEAPSIRQSPSRG